MINICIVDQDLQEMSEEFFLAVNRQEPGVKTLTDQVPGQCHCITPCKDNHRHAF